MLPLLGRILKLRKTSAKHVLNSRGQEGVSVNTFLLAASKSYPFTNFSKLDFDGSAGTNSSLLPKMTFILKMTKFRILPGAKRNNNIFSAQISFILGINF